MSRWEQAAISRTSTGRIYNSGLVTIGENSVIPPNIQIGKNTAVSGDTVRADYPNGLLESGGVLIKAGGEE